MKKRTLILILFSFLFVFWEVNAQTAEIDSLENLLRQYTKKDTIRVNLLNETVYNLYSLNIDKTLEYAKEAKVLADKLNYKKGKAESLKQIGIYYYLKSDYSKALEYYKNALKIYEELVDKGEISTSYNNIGNIYELQGDYSKALEYYQKSLKIDEEIGDKGGVSICSANIGIIYFSQGDYIKALEYYQKSLKIDKELGDKIGISISLMNIGIVYYSLKDYPKALNYYQKSLKIKKELDNKRGISSCYSKIGIIYFTQDDYIKALEYYQKALKVCIKTGDKPIETELYIGLSSLFLKQKKINEAYSYGKKAYILAEEIGNANLLKKSAEVLAESSEALGLFKEAYKYYVIFKTMNDSIYNENNVKKIAGLEYQYKYEKEKQATELIQQKKDAVHAEEDKRQKIVRNSFILGFVLMLVLVLVVLRSFIQKHKANKILAEQKQVIEKSNEELSQQKGEIQIFVKELKKANCTKDKFFAIIAHDLKSPLAGITYLTEMLHKQYDSFDEDKRKEFIMALYDSSKITFDLLQNLLTWSLSQRGQINFEPEHISIPQLISENISLLENSANKKGIELIADSDEDIKIFADKNMILTVLRNLISNAIKFTKENGKINIGCKLTEENMLKVYIKDTGIGINKKQIDKLFKIEENVSTEGTNKEKGTGLGLILCKEFVEKHEGKIWVDSEEGKGSIFSFTLPLKL